MYQIKINSTTGSELITNTDVKLFARIDTTADDNLLDEMITTARQNAENYLNSDIVAKKTGLITLLNYIKELSCLLVQWHLYHL